MNHEQEALERANAGQYEAAQFHATMYAAQQQRLSNLIDLARLESENNSTPTDAIYAIYDRDQEGYVVSLRTRESVKGVLGL